MQLGIISGIIIVTIIAGGIYYYSPTQVSTRISELIRENDTEGVRDIITSGADVNLADKNGYTPLNGAAITGNTEILKLLTDAGADANLADKEHGWTPLIWASFEGHTEIVKLLIEAGADINLADKIGNTSIGRKTSTGYTLTRAINVDAEEPMQEGYTPLYVAAHCGHTEIVKLLIDAGADVNKANKELICASIEGHSKIVQQLIESGADVNNGMKNDVTPLHMAASMGHAEMARLLIEKGADVNKTSKDGHTPLYSAADNGHTEIVKLLITSGADVNKADKYDTVTKCLKKMGIHVTEMTLNAWDALIRKNDTETIRLLIAAGADINRRGGMLLNYAAIYDRPEIAKLFIEASEIANKVDMYRPLTWASSEGYAEIVKLLIEKGANVNQADNDGHTPLYWAVKNGHTEIVELLKAAGAK